MKSAGVVAFFVVVLIILGVFGIVAWGSSNSAENRARCENQGGVYVVSRNFEIICIDSKSVIYRESQ